MWYDAVLNLAEREGRLWRHGAMPATMPEGGTVCACGLMVVWIGEQSDCFPVATPETVTLIRQVFDTAGTPPLATLDMQALRAWCGAYEATVKQKCRACHGTGRVECYACEQECDCDECDRGMMSVIAPVRPGRVGGQVFDRQLVARLPVELTGQAAVSVLEPAHAKGCPRLLLAGPGWRALVAGMDRGQQDTGPELLEGLAHAPAA